MSNRPVYYEYDAAKIESLRRRQERLEIMRNLNDRELIISIMNVLNGYVQLMDNPRNYLLDYQAELRLLKIEYDLLNIVKNERNL
jgi:hypothetical protein